MKDSKMHITCRIVMTFSYFKVYPSVYFIMLSSVKYRKHKVNFRTDATISLILYVHLSVCMEQSDSNWTDFHKISYSGVPNICQSILFWLKWTKITDTGHESLCVCVVWSLAVMIVFIIKTDLFSVRYRLSLKKQFSIEHQARWIVNTCVAC
jgi:hypothetical protein